MEQILTMDETVQEIEAKRAENEAVEQFSNPKTVDKRKINAGQIIMRQVLLSGLLIGLLMLFKTMYPDFYTQLNEYITARLNLMI